MSTAYTIRIHAVDGDPEGVRVIERMNWTGQGIAFRRGGWSSTKLRDSLARPGVYILAGYGNDEDDLMTLYIGEGDGVGDRIESHTKNKDFWAWGIAFVSTHTGLNKAHVQWLEWALESPRVSRRLQPLRRWSYEQTNKVFPGAARASDSHGLRAA